MSRSITFNRIVISLVIGRRPMAVTLIETLMINLLGCWETTASTHESTLACRNNGRQDHHFLYGQSLGDSIQ